MKNLRISFRLSPYHLAKALRIIKQLDPSYYHISNNDLVKTVFFDYIAKMTINRIEEIPQELINEVLLISKKTKKSGLSLEELMKIKNNN